MDNQDVQFTDKDFQLLERQSYHGERARQVREGKDWAWVKEFIFGALYDEAIMTLRNARTEEDRVKAQQMFLACEKPKRQLDFLVSQGDAARASLAELNATTLVETSGFQPNGLHPEEEQNHA